MPNVEVKQDLNGERYLVMQGSAVGVGIMGNIGKGLRAASFTSTEGVAGVEGREAGNGQEMGKYGACALLRHNSGDMPVRRGHLLNVWRHIINGIPERLLYLSVESPFPASN